MTSPRTIKRLAARQERGRPERKVRNFRRLTSRVYVASPIQTFATPRYALMIARIRSLLPDAELVPGRDLFSSSADWRQRWPALLHTLDAVVFFDDVDGCIGAGTQEEIADAERAGIPVFFLTWPPINALIRCDDTGGVEFWPVHDGGMQQTLRVACAVPAPDYLALVRGDD